MKGILTIEDGLQTTEAGRLQAERRRFGRGYGPQYPHVVKDIYRIEIRDFRPEYQTAIWFSMCYQGSTI